MLAQQVTAGDVRNAEPRGEPLGLCSLASAGSADQQQPHLPIITWIAIRRTSHLVERECSGRPVGMTADT